MRIHCKQGYSAQMEAFTEKIRMEPNQNGTDNLNNEKLELLQEFVKYLESEKQDKQKCKQWKGHHGKFEGKGHRFMFGHGFGKHGHHHHGKHHHGFGKHHHGFGKHHHHHGHGKHGAHGKHHHGGRPFCMKSHGETPVIEIDADTQGVAPTEVVTGANIGRQVPFFRPYHRGFCGRWSQCNRDQRKADQSCQTVVETEPQDILTQVQNISIESPPPVDLMKD